MVLLALHLYFNLASLASHLLGAITEHSNIMNSKILLIILFSLFLNSGIGQIIQTKEDIEEIRQKKIKSIKQTKVYYSTWNSSPEGQVTSIDSNYNLKIFDSTGRLIKEYIKSGMKLLRRIYYNSNKQAIREVSFYSKFQVYPKSISPKVDSDYSEVFKEIIYTYDTSNNLIQSKVAAGNNKNNVTTYIYDNKGRLVSQIETQPDGYIYEFTINKYANEKLDYTILNNLKSTQTKDYKYQLQNNKIIPTTIEYDDKYKSIINYDDEAKLLNRTLYNAENKIISRAEYNYCEFGVQKVLAFREPTYNSNMEQKSDKLRLTDETIYNYEIY